jgi:lipoate synthase
MAQQIGQLVNVETKTALPQHFDTSRMDELMSRSELSIAECDELRSIAKSLGFAKVASGPFVRSSYHAREMADSY